MDENTGTAHQEFANHNQRLVLWLLAAIAAVFAWRTVSTFFFNLIPDECSYWTWSRHLDWSYFDNSGGVAYLIRLSTELFGAATHFTVRFPFLVLSALGTYLIFRISFLLFADSSRALLAAVLLNLMPVSLLGGSAAMHDNALLFFWIASMWAAARFVVSENRRWFYVMGIAAGLAIQSKYTGVLVLISIFTFLCWSGQHRRVLAYKEPWLGALVAGLFTLPILWWNYRHDWASLHHVLFIGAGAESYARRFMDGVAYHLAQFLIVSPLFYYAVLVAIVMALLRNLFKPRPAEALLLSFTMPLILFGLLAFKGHIEANWAAMGYPSATILAVEMICRARAEGKSGIWARFNKTYLKWAVLLAVGPAILMVLHAWIGLLPASLERRFHKEDRIVWETRSWDGLGRHVASLRESDDVIAADSYQLCAALEFYVPGNPLVRYIAPWKRPTQFDVRERSFDNLNERNVLFVSPQPLEPSSAARTTIYENFARVEPLESYKVMYHGKAIREIHVYRGYKFNPFSPRRLGPRSLLYRDY